MLKNQHITVLMHSNVHQHAAVYSICSGTLTYADIVGRLLSKSHSPHKLTQQEWTADNRGNSYS